ncbi:hypothetical protein [Sediminicoccus sp. KRV36]|uniref:hypothetical protein n=1 Tax=Sediminicoccus sp. KRV36 TaxID=3133721 RepID=UPI00200F09A0|nr:hypothetical protein [Sediminicoccus rosea]UPY38326.1 hypothetical protein LHU95_06410 [Sediminicoccus rosea]
MFTRLAAAFAMACLAALPASAQGSGDCVANGMIQVLGFTATPAPAEREGRVPAGTIYSASLLGSRPFRMVVVRLSLAGRPIAAGLEVELPPGQVTMVRIARITGPTISDGDLRNGLRVTCMLP